MFHFSTLLLICLTFGLAIALIPQAQSTKLEVKKFENFIKKHNKKYNSKDEFYQRFKNFKSNLKRIEERNNDPNDHAVHGITKFADMTPEELLRNLDHKTDLNQKYFDKVQPAMMSLNKNDTPDSFDWRDEGAVTPVKDQGSCDAHGPFSAIGNIEGLYAIKTGNLTEFSEQQLISCDVQTAGCFGGYPYWGMITVIDEGGLETEEDYPYEEKEDFCKYNSSLAAVQVQRIVNLPDLHEEFMRSYLYKNGPLSACLNAQYLSTYTTGILNPTDCDTTIVNHCVVVVGYGNDGIPYWSLKNSWGSDFGEEGYARIARGSNTCGIEQGVISAVLA